MSYKKAYQNAKSITDNIRDGAANVDTAIANKGLARKRKNLGLVLGSSEQGKLMSAIMSRPDLRAMNSINKSFKNREPVQVASLEYDMNTQDKLPDGTIVDLTKEQKAERGLDLRDDTVTNTVEVLKEYDTDISKKLMKDLKVTFPDLNRKQISAIIGNLHHESKGFTQYQQTKGEGVSYAQWSGSRKTEFLDFSKDNNLDPKGYDAPLKFLVYELNNNRKHGFLNKKFSEAFNNPDASVEQLTEIFENNYLAAGTPLMPDRIADALIYNSDEGE